MTKKDLVLQAIHNQTSQRPPVGFWFHYAKDELVDGFKDPSVFEANIAGHKKYYAEFQPDFVKIMTDGFFIYPNEAILTAQSAKDLKKAKPIGEKHPWIEKQVEFAKTITAIFDGQVLSFYNIFAPLTLFHFSRGVETKPSLADFIAEDKEAAAHALKVMAQDLAALSRRVITEGGADGIYFSAQDAGDPRVTDEIRKNIIVPSDFAVLDGANSAGKLNILHICGYEGHRNNLAHFADYPAQIINWAVTVEKVSLGAGKKLFGGKPVIGGFDNTAKGVLYRGGKAEIEAETERLLKEAGATGVILGADCTVPRDINLDHLRWVREKAASFKSV